MFPVLSSNLAMENHHYLYAVYIYIYVYTYICVHVQLKGERRTRLDGHWPR